MADPKVPFTSVKNSEATANQLLVAQCSCPADFDTGPLIKALIEQRLAACIQQLPIHSSFYWEGALHNEDEQLLIIKTSSSCFAALSHCIQQHHPYEVPELLAWPIEQQHCLPDYWRWLMDFTQATTSLR